MTPNIIFGTPLWVLDAGLNAEELELLSDYATQCEEKMNGIRKSNNEFAYHSQNNFIGNFVNLPGAKKIGAIFSKCLLDYAYNVKSVNIVYWTIISRKYAFNSRHNHGDSLLSAALYIKVPNKSGAINFHDPRPGKLMSNMTGINGGNIQHQAIKVTPKEGMIVVFPSFLEHEVTMTLADEPRIIYSFNINPIEAKTI
jgi:uncharacterized protein (TIGR02466 family)